MAVLNEKTFSEMQTELEAVIEKGRRVRGLLEEAGTLPPDEMLDKIADGLEEMALDYSASAISTQYLALAKTARAAAVEQRAALAKTTSEAQ